MYKSRYPYTKISFLAFGSSCSVEETVSFTRLTIMKDDNIPVFQIGSSDLIFCDHGDGSSDHFCPYHDFIASNLFPMTDASEHYMINASYTFLFIFVFAFILLW